MTIVVHSFQMSVEIIACSKNCEAKPNELIKETWSCSTALKESVTELVDTIPSRFGRMRLARPISAKVDNPICDKNSNCHNF